MPTTLPPKPLAPQVGIAGVAKPSDLFHQFLTKLYEWLRLLREDVDDHEERITVLETPRGALVKRTTDLTAVDYSTATAMAWDAEIYDTAAIHDNSTNNTRLTVPSGVTWVQIEASVATNNVSPAAGLAVDIRKNGTIAFDGYSYDSVGSGAYNTPGISYSTPPLSVVAGDYFEVFVGCTDTSIDIVAAKSWAHMTILG